jgi:ArsR family transcriptional regulator
MMRAMDDKQLYITFGKAIGDETRATIMEMLCCVWLSVNDVVDRLDDVKQPTVSHHLKVLEESGLVYMRQVGRQRFYTLNRRAVQTCCNVVVTRLQALTEADVVPIDEIPVLQTT